MSLESIEKLRKRFGFETASIFDDDKVLLAQMCSAIEHEVAERYVELPLDADGVPIHVGDLMEGGKKVARIVLTDGEWEPYVQLYDKPNYLREYFCSEISRYKPTVEDVLREMADRCYADEDEPRDRDAIVAEYAAKFRLAGEE